MIPSFSPFKEARVYGSVSDQVSIEGVERLLRYGEVAHLTRWTAGSALLRSTGGATVIVEHLSQVTPAIWRKSLRATAWLL